MCGIIGFAAADDSPEILKALPIYAVDGLTGLQHRGTESAGLVGSNGKDRFHFDIVKGHGLVRDVFNEESITKLKG